MITPEGFAEAFSLGRQPKEQYRYATVVSVSGRTVGVRLNSSVVTLCPSLYSAEINDRVQVVIKTDGSVVAIGKVG